MSDESYEMKAWQEGRRYHAENPSAPGTWSTDAAGKPLYLVEVPGWHLFSTYDLWFRMGYTAAMQGRTTVVGASLLSLASAERKQALKHAGMAAGAGLGLALAWKMFFGGKKRSR